MKYLFSEWKKIEKLIEKSSYIVLLTDYDGTLSPIRPKPEDAFLDRDTREMLGLLSKKERFCVGVISGRRLSDIKRLVRLKGVFYVGNHGMEIKGPGINYRHPLFNDIKMRLSRIKEKLLTEIRSIKGAIIEYKGGSLSLHYRLAKRRDIRRLRKIFMEVCNPYLKKGIIKISRGKKVWEIRPPFLWNKGSAVGKILEILPRRKILPIYIGDDVTDEDAFSFLKKKGLTIFVGTKKTSCAEYYLKSTNEVKKFLIRLCQV